MRATGRMPKSLTARQRMDRKLRTKRGRALYRQRGAAIEPVFGQMKDRQGAGRFSMRGLERCRGEWQLDAAVHNLRKLHRDSVRRAESTGNSETTIRNQPERGKRGRPPPTCMARKQPRRASRAIPQQPLFLLCHLAWGAPYT